MFYYKSERMISWADDMTLLETKLFKLAASVFNQERELPVFVPNHRLVEITMGEGIYKAATRATECLDLREFKSPSGERFAICTAPCLRLDGGWLVYLNPVVAGEVVSDASIEYGGLQVFIDMLRAEVMKGE